MKIIQVGAKVGFGECIGRGNAGDTAIGMAFNYLFEKEFPRSKVTFMNCRKIFSQNDVQLINKGDVLFISGGGLFLNDTFPNSVSDWQWGISKDLIDKIKIPIIVYSVGYNKFRKQREFNKNFNETVNKLVEKSLFFSLRNTGSCKALKKHINKKFYDKIFLNFCPTMVLAQKYKLKHETKTGPVAFVLAGDRLENRHQNLRNFVRQIESFVSYLKKNGITTILVNHQNDVWIKKYVNFDKFIDLYEKDSRFIYETYSKMDVVVADRGHAQMIPLACGCKVLSPISHDKLKWFLDDVNLGEFGIEEYDKNLSNKLIMKYEKLNQLNWEKEHKRIMDMVMKQNNDNMLLIKQTLGIFLTKRL